MFRLAAVTLNFFYEIFAFCDAACSQITLTTYCSDCLSITGVSVRPAKTDEPIDLPFRYVAWGPVNYVSGGGPDPFTGRGNFEGNTLACPDLLVVKILNFSR